MAAESLVAHRGRILHCLGDPGEEADPAAVEYFSDGVLMVDAGRIVDLGPAASVLPKYPGDVTLTEHRGNLLIPGMIDCHVHYPQIDIIASCGDQLLDWLNHYTFPVESRFDDSDEALSVAEFFLDELLRNGTTTALVFATVHPQSVDAIFAAALKRTMRLAAGKVLMDRNCPEALQDDAASAYRDSRELLERWHGQGRLHYAITPRFAPTCSDAQLAAAGKLAAEFPETLVHTHLAENIDEVAWVADLFPASRSYLDVYKQAGLLRERSVFAHCLHLDEQDYVDLAAAGGAMAFCPTSNLFLGSGLFDLARARGHRIRVGLGTDVGGGTSLGMLRTMSEAYKVLQLNRQTLSSYRALFLVTLGAAEALYMDDRIGNFALGKDADFITLNYDSTPLMQRRLEHAEELTEELFVLIMLGDDRAISAAYVMGELAYSKE